MKPQSAPWLRIGQAQYVEGTSKGLEPYRMTWETFFSWSSDPVVFDIREMTVTAGTDVAFVTAVMRCAGTEANGVDIELDFRLTIGLRKINSQWIVAYDVEIPLEEARNVRRAWCFGEYRQGRRRGIAPAEEEGPRRVARRRQGEGVGRSGCGCRYRRCRRRGSARACLQRRGRRLRPPSAELQFEPRARGQQPPHKHHRCGSRGRRRPTCRPALVRRRSAIGWNRAGARPPRRGDCIQSNQSRRDVRPCGVLHGELGWVALRCRAGRPSDVPCGGQGDPPRCDAGHRYRRCAPAR